MLAVTSGDRDRYDVDVAVALPPLAQLIGGRAGATEIDAVSQRHEVTYFDTADRRLARAALVLRRRIGGDEAGWLVEVPGADGVLPVRYPAGRSAVTVPAAIRRLVWVNTRGEALRPVARVVTQRTTHRLVDAAGEVVVDLVDDKVRGERLNGVPEADVSTAEWRVVEVDTEVREWQDAVAAGLRHLGAREADDRTDLARVGDDGVDDWRAAEAGGRGQARRASPESPAGEVVLRYVRHQLDQIITNDPLVRLDTPGSVHRMRVATRRLRSALQTFRPVLRAEAVVPVRSELKWLAGELGAARDAEVMRERMLTAVHEEDSHVHLGPLGDTIDTTLAEAYRTAHAGLLRALDSQRYHRLIVALHDLVSDPPLTGKAGRPAREVLPRRAARAFSRLKALIKAAHHAATPTDRDTQLHEARKAAKKARYAGESMVDFFGKPAARFALAMENVQEELGEHQDSVVMRARIEELAHEESSTAATFNYGRLHAHEEQRGELAVERFETAWRKSKKKNLRDWFN